MSFGTAHTHVFVGTRGLRNDTHFNDTQHTYAGAEDVVWRSSVAVLLPLAAVDIRCLLTALLEFVRVIRSARNASRVRGVCADERPSMEGRDARRSRPPIGMRFGVLWPTLAAEAAKNGLLCRDAAAPAR